RQSQLADVCRPPRRGATRPRCSPAEGSLSADLDVGGAWPHSLSPAALRRGDRRALQRQTGGGPPWTSALLAATYAQAGRLDEARQEAVKSHAAHPSITIASLAANSVYADAALRDHLIEGLRKAALPE